MKLITHIISGTMPLGSYRDTCPICSWDKVTQQLSCLCQKENGGWSIGKPVIVSSVKDYVVNCDGILKINACE